MKKLFEVNDNKNVELIGDNENKVDISEEKLEELLFNNPQLISDNLLYIGRQVYTETNKRLDLVAVDESGAIHIIELKRGEAPREIIAQVLDYTSWFHKISERQIEDIAKKHFEKYNVNFRSLSDAFQTHFKHLAPRRIGEEVKPILIADDFPPDMINSTNYLYDRGVPIRCLEFDYFNGKNKNGYFQIECIVGEDDNTISSDIKDVKKTNYIVSNDKAVHRIFLSNLSNELNKRYSQWYNNLKCPIQNEFKIYQDRPGDWSTSHLDWHIDDRNILCLEIALWKSENNEKWLSVFFWFRKKLEKNTYEKVMQIVNEIISTKFDDKIAFEDDSHVNQPNIRTDIKYETLDQEFLNSYSIKCIDILKPYLERIMDLS
ncbi:MAG: endonuclease NucS domain-containing protein [Phycisphaerales bacterium]